MTPVRIAIFISSLDGGGAERVMVTLANGFAQRGHRVDLVLVKAVGPFLKEVHSSVRVVDLKASRVLTSLPKLVGYLRRERPAVMLSALHHANVVAIIARKVAGVPCRLLVSERSNYSMTLQNAKTAWQRLVMGMVRATYPKADGVIAVSNGVAEDLKRNIPLPADFVHVIYNPVVTEALLAAKDEIPDHPWLCNDDFQVIMSVGRLSPEKEYAQLIQSFALIRAHRPVKLIILGEGDLRADLELLVSKLGLEGEVDLPGFKGNPFSFLRMAKVFVLCSKWEGLPNALIQAMACGTPVVSTDCPSGPGEILENGLWGRLVPVGDVDALAAAIVSTLDETNHPDVAARASAFNLDRSVEAYLDVLLKF